MNGKTLTVESLREELRAFASDALRRELEDMKASILNDLRKENAQGLQRLTKPARWDNGNASSGIQERTPFSERSLKLMAKEENGSQPVEDGTTYVADSASSKNGYMCLRSEREQTMLDGIEEISEEECNKGSTFCAKLVSSDSFNGVISVVIILNILFIAACTDYMARYWTRSRPVAFRIIEVGFCAIYLCELTMKICVLRKGFFFGKKCQGWNWFDFTLVVLQVGDLSLTPVLAPDGKGDAVAGRAMMALRGVRILRVFRIARVLHLVPNLRMLLNSLAFSIKSLVWVMLLVFLTILVFGIVLTQVVADHKLDVGREEMEEEEALEERFGTLDRSMLALYQVITDGLHWAELSEPLMEFISPCMVIVIIMYTMFALFAMMNVLTAFFCENLAKSGQEDRNVQVYQEIWQALNRGGNPNMTEEQFTNRMDEPDMKNHLAELELTPEEMVESHFFQLLDKDKSGTVNVKELMTGCVRLTQSAKAVDVLGLALDIRAEKAEAEAYRDRVEAQLNKIIGMMPPPGKR